MSPCLALAFLYAFLQGVFKLLLRGVRGIHNGQSARGVIVNIAEESHEAATDETAHDRIIGPVRGSGVPGTSCGFQAAGGAGNGLDLRVALRAAHEANMTELCASASSILELPFVQSASRNLEKGKREEMARDSRENDSR